MSRSTRPRVPAALHGELTEYASLLRALRTQHTLDLSAHLSQLPQRSSQSLDNEGESELVSSDEDDSVPADKDERLPLEDNDGHSAEPSQPRRSASIRTDKPEESPPARHSQSQSAARFTTGKKRKRQSTNDTWTRWPLLVGDVYHPEWDLADEVNHIASHVSCQRRQHSGFFNNESSQHSQQNFGDDDDCVSSTEHEENTEVAEVVSRVLAASTAAHLRSLLSACSTLVPRVEPSLRSRLAPLNWKSILAAAGSAGLVSPQTLERAQTRLEALYSPGFSSVSSNRSPSAYQQVSSTPSSMRRPTYAACVSAVKAARRNLHSAIAARVEQGDGDFLSFLGPPPPRPAKTRKGAKMSRRSGTKQEESHENDDKALVKNEDNVETSKEKGERNDSELESDSADSASECSDLVRRDEG